MQGLQGTQGVQGLQGIKGDSEFQVIDIDEDKILYPTLSEIGTGSTEFVNISLEKLAFNPSSGSIGIGTSIISNRLTVSGTATATSYFGSGDTLSGIVTQIVPGIGIDIFETQVPGKGKVEVQSYKPVGRTIFVSINGDDNNTGLAENHPKKTIKGASSVALTNDTIKVFPGTYVEDNPVILNKIVSIEGTELRNCIITPKNPNQDLIYVNNGCHITDISFIGPEMTDGSAVVALQPLLGVSTDRFFDAARMIRLNIDYIAKESVGFLTSGYSGFAGNHREQDAARLIDLNTDYIAAETVGFLTTAYVGTNGQPFVVTDASGNVTNPVNCEDDIKTILNKISYDLKANSNKKSIESGLSYYDDGGTLLHIIGNDQNGNSIQDATISAIDYAIGITTYIINSEDHKTQPGVTTYSQLAQNATYSPILVGGGCTAVIEKIKNRAGIITNIINDFNYSSGITTIHGVTLESNDCADDVGNVWRSIIYDITRGGNSKSVGAGKSYFDDEWNLAVGTLDNEKGEIEQTIATLDYSFDVARAVINNSTWGSTIVGVGTTVVSADYDYSTGITTITATDHGLLKDDAVKIENLTYSCTSGSSGVPVGVITASYTNSTGITTIQTSGYLPISSGDRVKIEGLTFECVDGTDIYPDGNQGYEFTVQDVITSSSSSTTFIVNTGSTTYTNPHTYVSGGQVSKLYTPIFTVDDADYDYLTGITTVTVTGTGPGSAYLFIKPGKRIKLGGLVFSCDQGQSVYPSGNNGYDFEVIATTDDRYVDAANLIKANRTEIIDKSLASIALAQTESPYFYYPNDVETTRFSRFKSAYRLIQFNRQQIIDDAWTATQNGNNPADAAVETKCKRDIGYFVDAVSTDIFTGGNSYSIAFVKLYFEDGTPISNGLDGEELASIDAFNASRDLMKQAITNQLNVTDTTLTPDPSTGSNTDTDSCANVQSAIDTLSSIVTIIIDNGNLDLLKTTYVNTGSFVAGENKCRRDIGYIVDAVEKDIRYGTNKFIRESTRAYFDANGAPITNGLLGEETESITAFNSVRDYAKKAITNQLNVKDLTITADPNTGDNQSSGSCANVQSNIDNLIATITTVISDGNLSNYPALFVSNKVEVNTGTTTKAHTYVNGGTLTSNYTSEIYPDGTFGYVFPVKNVLSDDVFEVVTGKTVLPHTYESGGTVKKFRNFQSEFTQVKDLSIQADYKTGFNNTINSCADVTSAMHVCVGIVTNIVGLGSTAFSTLGFSTTYPGNRGEGFDHLSGISSAVYEKESGKTTIKTLGYTPKVGDLVEIRDMLFSCSSGGSISTSRFPSGYYGYEFYVTNVNSNKSFDVYTGISTIAHNYVSGGYVVNRSMSVTQADYTHTTGIVTITSPGIKLRSGDLVNIRDLEFVCGDGSVTSTIYPTGNNGYDFRVISADNENDTFTVNVGTSSVDHTYVVGGKITPPYSRGVGNIVQGPYVRNCTNFIPKSIGMKVDGFDAEPGNLPDIGVTGTMSVDSYTQYNQGGIGVSITNGAYSQLVSIFTICNDLAVFTGSGGQCDLTNSNSSFGRFGLVADGVGDSATKSIYRYTGITSGVSEVEQDTVVVSGIGTYRPYDGQAIYFGDLYFTVQSIKVTDSGSGYTTPPLVVVSDPEGPNGIVCEGSSNIDASGRVISVDIISGGSQYLTNPTVQFIGGGGVGAAATTKIYPLYYSIESATKPDGGVSTIILNQNLNNTVGSGTTVYFSRVSLQITSSHSFEWVGAGNNIFEAKPGLGGVVITENEVIMDNGGQVVYTSTDQAGNFKIGDQFTINQLTGTISGRAFSQSLLNTVTPLILALG